jgi:hypothetical protein
VNPRGQGRCGVRWTQERAVGMTVSDGVGMRSVSASIRGGGIGRPPVAG